MPRKVISCIVLTLAALSAHAQSTYVDVEQRFNPSEMHEAGLDTLSPAQLQALNRLLREKAPDTAAASAPLAARDERGNDPHRSYIGLDDTPVHSRVKGTVAGWEPGTVFELENGQQWKVLKGEMKLRKPLQAPEIEVIPGVAGRWFLQIDEDMPKARVYRID